MDQNNIENRTYIAALCDIYGVLLTQKQRFAMQLFYEEDYSLSEIAEQFSSTRQAVNDILKRSVTALENYESALNLFIKQKQQSKEVEKAVAFIEASNLKDPEKVILTEIIKNFRR